MQRTLFIFSIIMLFLAGCQTESLVSPTTINTSTSTPKTEETIILSDTPKPTETLQPSSTPRPSYTPSQTLKPTRTVTVTSTPIIDSIIWLRSFTEDDAMYIWLNFESMFGENYEQMLGITYPQDAEWGSLQWNKWVATQCWFMFEKVDDPEVNRSNFFTSENIDYEMAVCPNSSYYEFFVENNCTDPVYPDPDWKSTCKTSTPTITTTDSP